MAAPQALRAVRNQQDGTSAPAPQNFPAMLEKYKNEIARALPKHLNADRMARIALTSFRMTPKLAKCDPRSVFAAVIQASQLGTEVGGLMGEAHLVPFGNQCQLIIGYTGLMKLARNGGNVTDIYSHEVRKKDTFSLSFGMERSLKHEPLSLDGGFPASDEDRGEVVGFYAVAVFKDGSRTFVAMGRSEVEKIRDNSRGYKAAKEYKKQSLWDTDFVSMGLKTAIRRLCKFLPKSPELATALALDSANERGKNQNIDLNNAIDGVFTPIEDEEIDAETGEISPAPQKQSSQQQPISPTKAESQSEQVGQDNSTLGKALKALASATSIEELDELFIRLEIDVNGNDLEALNIEYRRVKANLADDGSGLF